MFCFETAIKVGDADSSPDQPPDMCFAHCWPSAPTADASRPCGCPRLDTNQYLSRERFLIADSVSLQMFYWSTLIYRYNSSQQVGLSCKSSAAQQLRCSFASAGLSRHSVAEVTVNSGRLQACYGTVQRSMPKPNAVAMLTHMKRGRDFEPSAYL